MMQHSAPPSKRPGRHAAVPLHWALALCLAAFLAGRWLTHVTQRSLQEPESWQQVCLQQSGILRHRPPVQAGASGSTQYTLAPYQILSWYPRVVLYPSFIDDARAASIIQLAQGRLQPSTVTLPGEVVQETPGRSSSGAFVTESDDPSGALEWLAKKIQDVTLLPASHGEKFNLIKYKAGEEYSPHLDPHDEPGSSGPHSSRRIATLVVYLSDVAAGGETIFPREGRDGADRPVGPGTCSSDQGLTYKPRKGDAVLFFSTTPDLALDPRSLHAGCPVGEGSEKWVVTKWLRDKQPVADGGFGFAE